MNKLTKVPGDVVAQLLRRGRLRWVELLPWVVAISVYLAFPLYLSLGKQILIMVLFALSLDLIVGYTGIVTLGHAAFFGLGAYAAGLLAAHGLTDPLLGLTAAFVVSALLGIASGYVILRTTELTLVMLTMIVALVLLELANRFSGITGGFDGLSGITVDPILGIWEFDFLDHTAFVYCLVVLFAAWAFVRKLVSSPFGRSLLAIKESPVRMRAIGTPVYTRKLEAYAISAGLAGLAGALSAQTNLFVSLDVFSFDMSGTILVMLVFGGTGRLYGAFVGVPLYMVAQNWFSISDPVFWLFWMGLLLIAIVLFSPGGIIGMFDNIGSRLRRVRDDRVAATHSDSGSIS